MESKLLRIIQYNSTKPLAFLCLFVLLAICCFSSLRDTFLLPFVYENYEGKGWGRSNKNFRSQSELTILYITFHCYNDSNSLSVRVFLLIQILFFQMYICPYGIVFLKRNFGYVAEKCPKVSERGNIFRSFGTATR